MHPLLRKILDPPLLNKANQNGLQRDNCDTWFHSRCCAVSDELYYALVNSSCSWICCSFGVPNFSSLLFTISDLPTPSKFDSPSSFPEFGNFAASTPILNKTKSQSSSASTSYSSPKKENKITGMILNCNGLKGLDHITQFQALLDLHKPDIFRPTGNWIQAVPRHS